MENETEKIYFKTSYVIVYRPSPRLWVFVEAISKHLMLLFIKMRILSGIFPVGISKHLMLLFILIVGKLFFSSVIISKHLMLLFIVISCSVKDYT